MDFLVANKTVFLTRFPYSFLAQCVSTQSIYPCLKTQTFQDGLIDGLIQPAWAKTYLVAGEKTIAQLTGQGRLQNQWFSLKSFKFQSHFIHIVLGSDSFELRTLLGQDRLVFIDNLKQLNNRVRGILYLQRVDLLSQQVAEINRIGLDVKMIPRIPVLNLGIQLCKDQFDSKRFRLVKVRQVQKLNEVKERIAFFACREREAFALKAILNSHNIIVKLVRESSNRLVKLNKMSKGAKFVLFEPDHIRLMKYFSQAQNLFGPLISIAEEESFLQQCLQSQQQMVIIHSARWAPYIQAKIQFRLKVTRVQIDNPLLSLGQTLFYLGDSANIKCKNQVPACCTLVLEENYVLQVQMLRLHNLLLKIKDPLTKPIFFSDSLYERAPVLPDKFIRLAQINSIAKVAELFPIHLFCYDKDYPKVQLFSGLHSVTIIKVPQESRSEIKSTADLQQFTQIKVSSYQLADKLSTVLGQNLKSIRVDHSYLQGWSVVRERRPLTQKRLLIVGGDDQDRQQLQCQFPQHLPYQFRSLDQIQHMAGVYDQAPTVLACREDSAHQIIDQFELRKNKRIVFLKRQSIIYNLITFGKPIRNICQVNDLVGSNQLRVLESVGELLSSIDRRSRNIVLVQNQRPALRRMLAKHKVEIKVVKSQGRHLILALYKGNPDYQWEALKQDYPQYIPHEARNKQSLKQLLQAHCHSDIKLAYYSRAVLPQQIDPSVQLFQLQEYSLPQRLLACYSNTYTKPTQFNQVRFEKQTKSLVFSTQIQDSIIPLVKNNTDSLKNQSRFQNIIQSEKKLDIISTFQLAFNQVVIGAVRKIQKEPRQDSRLRNILNVQSKQSPLIQKKQNYSKPSKQLKQVNCFNQYLFTTQKNKSFTKASHQNKESKLKQQKQDECRRVQPLCLEIEQEDKQSLANEGPDKCQQQQIVVQQTIESPKSVQNQPIVVQDKQGGITGESKNMRSSQAKSFAQLDERKVEIKYLNLEQELNRELKHTSSNAHGQAEDQPSTKKTIESMVQDDATSKQSANRVSRQQYNRRLQPKAEYSLVKQGRLVEFVKIKCLSSNPKYANLIESMSKTNKRVTRVDAVTQQGNCFLLAGPGEQIQAYYYYRSIRNLPNVSILQITDRPSRLQGLFNRDENYSAVCKDVSSMQTAIQGMLINEQETSSSPLLKDFNIKCGLLRLFVPSRRKEQIGPFSTDRIQIVSYDSLENIQPQVYNSVVLIEYSDLPYRTGLNRATGLIILSEWPKKQEHWLKEEKVIAVVRSTADIAELLSNVIQHEKTHLVQTRQLAQNKIAYIDSRNPQIDSIVTSLLSAGLSPVIKCTNFRDVPSDCCLVTDHESFHYSGAKLLDKENVTVAVLTKSPSALIRLSSPVPILGYFTEGETLTAELVRLYTKQRQIFSSTIKPQSIKFYNVKVRVLQYPNQPPLLLEDFVSPALRQYVQFVTEEVGQVRPNVVTITPELLVIRDCQPAREYIKVLNKLRNQSNNQSLKLVIFGESGAVQAWAVAQKSVAGFLTRPEDFESLLRQNLDLQKSQCDSITNHEAIKFIREAQKLRGVCLSKTLQKADKYPIIPLCKPSSFNYTLAIVDEPDLTTYLELQQIWRTNTKFFVRSTNPRGLEHLFRRFPCIAMVSANQDQLFENVVRLLQPKRAGAKKPVKRTEAPTYDRVILWDIPKIIASDIKIFVETQYPQVELVQARPYDIPQSLSKLPAAVIIMVTRQKELDDIACFLEPSSSLFLLNLHKRAQFKTKKARTVAYSVEELLAQLKNYLRASVTTSVRVRRVRQRSPSLQLQRHDVLLPPRSLRRLQFMMDRSIRISSLRAK